ncbi:helix-turn-helix domain-containing protein [Acidithiobacillus concretivorus]|uniref:Transposase family protein n=1 Tax=Acidithiobacillus concretivorus TaxID=3063952 RepID=A0ABS5ZMT9_9PROT|nr:helix-turn-helix domain-containing protein [Acidithiobacillus concretivorus]MBU2737966.1 transposase family protein [Acidithiobacillus concretivorus]
MNKRVGLYVNARRFICRDCGKTFMETLPEVDSKRRMTERRARWIGPHSLLHTFTSVAEEIGITEGTVRNIAHDCCKRLDKSQFAGIQCALQSEFALAGAL